MTDHDVIETRGNYRVRLEINADAPMPYNDGGTPVLRVETGRWNGPLVEELTEITSYRLPHEIVYALRWLVDEYGRGRGLEMFARYLRIFHGSTSLVTRGPDNNTDYTYVSFDTEAWREEVGVTPAEGHEIADLSEINAWLDGEVYGAIVEERIRTTTQVYRGDAPEPFDEVEGEGWVEAEAVWGHYGRERAERAAREALASWEELPDG